MVRHAWIAVLAAAACDRNGDKTPVVSPPVVSPPVAVKPAPAPAARPAPPAGSGSDAADDIDDLLAGLPPTSTTSGDTTRLVVAVKGLSAVMDAPDPSTTLELLAGSAGGSAQPVVRLKWQQEWRVLGFDHATHTYVLGEIATHGAWRVLDAIQYLDERGATHESRFRTTDHLVALSSATSPDGGHAALVAQPDAPAVRDGFRLYLLDVAGDKLRVLGRAPAPPPEDDPSMCQAGAWVWGDLHGVAFYEPMDAALRFDAGKLIATYGADTCRARATKRTSMEWPVAGP